MNVLVATPWLPPGGGGLERYAARVASELERAGHGVTMLGHGDALRPALRLSNTPFSRAVYARAGRLLRAGGVDVVHVHTPVPGTAELVALAARRARVPYVVTYHAGELGAPPGLLRAAAALHASTFERRMLVGAAARIAVSPFVARRALRGLSSSVVPPGVDAERFTPGGDPEAGRVLFVGPPSRAYAWKGLAVLAEAVARVPGARLRVVGDGDLAPAYRARGVHVTGRIDDAALVDEYRRASVVALPSLTHAESFGMVLAEANACGRAVVASDVGGVSSFVRDGENGLLVPPGDVGALADALAVLLADPARAACMGRRGREIVLRDHRWSDVARRTEAILEAARVTGASGPARAGTSP